MDLTRLVLTINLSILDFKEEIRQAFALYHISINLSILDFKEKYKDTPKTYEGSINLSILDFKEPFFRCLGAVFLL